MPIQCASSSLASIASPVNAVAVLLPLPLAGAYDYAVPPTMAVRRGDFVAVPLGRRQVIGVVWGEAAGAVAEARLKPIAMRLDTTPLPPTMLRFIDWVAQYTVTPPGAVLKMAMSVPAALEPPRFQLGYRLAADAGAKAARMTPARRRVLEVAAAAGGVLPALELAQAAGVGPAVLRGLAEMGLLEGIGLAVARPLARPDGDHAGPDLSETQRLAAVELVGAVAARHFAAILLDGVTGSGKTEVYFEAVAEALRQGRQVLVLLPEIALSAQWLARFEARFGAKPAVWHSDLTPAQRRDTWRAVASGEARVLVGARSALFLPFAELGLIVVDEEHDGAFKQEEGVIYHARDMAVVRAHQGEFAIVLASATPSLETMLNAESGRYRRLCLPARHAGASMPRIGLVDMRADRPGRLSWLSPSLKKALTDTFAQGEQAMLFLNRRGYAPLTLCRGCGHRLQCPSCTAWLVEHRAQGRLQCHHCGHTTTLPSQCPSCQGTEWAACGPGVERLAEEVAALFPEHRVEIMASDNVTTAQAAEALVRRVRDHEVDLLIGTQVVAKGHHFPMLTLVGVIDADLGLAGGDLRAAERTFQILHQVSGRAGRAERPGRVLVQTYMPEHPVMRALLSGDRDQFLATEAEARRTLSMPPFGRLAALIVSSPEEARADRMARALGFAAPSGTGIDVLGPAPAPLSLLRGRYRRRLLLKAPRNVAIQTLLRQWLARVPADPQVRVQVDIDPYSFL